MIALEFPSKPFYCLKFFLCGCMLLVVDSKGFGDSVKKKKDTCNQGVYVPMGKPVNYYQFM